MADESACFTCSNNERLDLPPRERIYVGPGWRVAHAFGTALPGWLVVLPRRHVTALDELTAAEAGELGPLLRAVTRALREATGCDKTYVALFAEAEAFAHVHFHVVPRHGDLDPGLRGPRVFNLLGADPDRSVPDAAMDEIALRIAAALTARRETTDRPRYLNAARHVWLSLALRQMAAFVDIAATWRNSGERRACRLGSRRILTRPGPYQTGLIAVVEYDFDSLICDPDL